MLLEVEDVKKFFGGVRAIDGVSFSLNEGQVLALIGPNGAGKSTMFNVVSGLYQPAAGAIHFAGHNVSRSTPAQMSRLGVARTFQKIRLFRGLTVMQNVIIGSQSSAELPPWRYLLGGSTLRSSVKATEESAHALLDMVGLQDMHHARADSLSYGQQRMLEIARALATKPRLLLIDEPAAGLNLAEAESLVGRLRSIRDMGVTLMLVEHNMDLVMDIADHIVVMNFGKKLAEGTPKDIQQNDDVIRAYLGEDAAG